MKTRVTWLEDMTYVAQSPSGHAVVMDGPLELGGHNLGPRPMEMLLMGMGGCTAIDVVDILRKSRQDLRGCEVQLKAQRADNDPKVFTTIQVHFILTGKNLSAKHIERAIQLSAEKYCSASIMLGKTAQITHTFEIRDA
ncbi:MAG: peroxiredoxin [Proteobacteria bacterium]|jgi:putative redox protein|nr:peroxiredoxin [Pseudomonadota bacterium]MBS1247845.1 peroxiredoxin [Pseudomonadota bacterium]MCU0806775.1 OsmC family protein [Candidatus Contendobacter sp.]